MPRSENGRLVLHTSAGDVKVNAPGLEVTLTPREPYTSPKADIRSMFAKADPRLHPQMDELGAVLQENGFMEHIELSLDEVRPIGGAMPVLMIRPSSSVQHMEMEVPVPPEHLVIAMVSTNGIVQWYLSATPPQQLRQARRTIKTSGAAETAHARFLIPAHPSLDQNDKQAGLLSFGVGSAAGRIIKFFKVRIIKKLIGAVGAELMQYIASTVEGRLKVEGLVYFEPGFPRLQPVQIKELKNTRVLLLVHGIFSSIEGCYKDLLANQGLMAQLKTIYGRNIVGYDHWTVAKTPLQNARDLLNLLPDNGKLDIDIVCHSRGGLVTRAILEYPQLMPLCKEKIGKVRNAIFVAGANQGSDLASYNNWSSIFNVFSALASAAGGVTLGVIVGVIKVVAHSLTALPSIKALAPDQKDEPNDFLKRMNGCEGVEVGNYCVAHANYDPEKFGMLSVVDPIIDAVFKQKANDLVVPFDGAATFDKWIDCRINLPFGTDTESQGAVYHTIFFKQAAVQNWLQSQLL